MTGAWEIIVIAAVVLILFGAAAIPRFAKSLGQAKAEFEKGVKEGRAEKGKENDRDRNPKHRTSSGRH
jgi:sec-independent protein translocase protein TatA